MSRYWRPFVNDPVSSSKFGVTMTDIEYSFSNSIGKGVLSGCTLTSLGGLSLNVAGGVAFYAGGALPVPSKVLSLTNNATNYVYCTTNFNSATRFYEPDIISNTTGTEPANSLLLGRVITSGGSISSINTSTEYPLLSLENISDRIGAGTIGGGILALPTGSAVGEIPVIQADGRILSSLIPAIEITNVFPVADIAAMLALSQASTGDVAVIASLNKSYILAQPPASVSGNWIEILAPGQVVSVAGKSGVVTLTTADISGLNYGAYMPTGNTLGSVPVVEIGNLLNAAIIPVLPANTKISGLGTSAYASTGTVSGTVPVITSTGFLDPSIFPLISASGIVGLNYGAYMPTGNLVNQLPVVEASNLLNPSIIPFAPINHNVSGGIVGINNDAPTATLDVVQKVGNTAGITLSLKASAGQTGDINQVLNSANTLLSKQANNGFYTNYRGISSPYTLNGTYTDSEIFGLNSIGSAAITSLYALGRNTVNVSLASITNAVLVGENTVNSTSFNSSISIGKNTYSATLHSDVVTIGFNNSVPYRSSITIGNNNSSSAASSSNIFIGNNITGNIGDAVIIGHSITMPVTYSSAPVIIGSKANVDGDLNVAIGYQPTVKNFAVAIGRDTVANQASVSIGHVAIAPSFGITLGNQSSSTTASSVVIGNQQVIPSTVTTAGILIGSNNATIAATGLVSLIGVGVNNTFGSNSVNEIVFGKGNISTSSGSNVVVGENNNTNIRGGDKFAIVFGSSNIAGSGSSSGKALLLGKGNSSTNFSDGNISIGIGESNIVSSYSQVIGQANIDTGNASLIIGTSNSSSGVKNVIVGTSNNVTSSYSVIYGCRVGMGSQGLTAGGGYKNIYFGAGITGTSDHLSSAANPGADSISPLGITLWSTSASGADVQGQDFHIKPGYGTGSRKSGDFTIQTAGIPGPSSAVANSTYIERVRIKSNGEIKIRPASASLVNLVLQGLASQTANILEVQNSTSTILAKVESNGVIQAAGYKSSAGNAGATATTGGAIFENGLYVSGSISSGGSSFTWSTITTSQSALVNKGYVVNSVSNVVITLPTTSVVGDVIKVTGINTGGWQISQNSGQVIYFSNLNTTVGTGGSLSSSLSRNSIELVCVVANTEWNVVNSVGSITVV